MKPKITCQTSKEFEAIEKLLEILNRQYKGEIEKIEKTSFSTDVYFSRKFKDNEKLSLPKGFHYFEIRPTSIRVYYEGTIVLIFPKTEQQCFDLTVVEFEIK